MEDQSKKPLNVADLDVTELEDSALEDVTGGTGDLNPGCQVNPGCTVNPGCSSGPSPNQNQFSRTA